MLFMHWHLTTHLVTKSLLDHLIKPRNFGQLKQESATILLMVMPEKLFVLVSMEHNVTLLELDLQIVRQFCGMLEVGTIFGDLE
jgi:hypothetical protein